MISPIEHLPQLDHPAEDTAYLTDATGVRWRVHELAAYGAPLARPFHRKRLPLQAPSANTRYFVNAQGDSARTRSSAASRGA